jgi:hypothetical protein
MYEIFGTFTFIGGGGPDHAVIPVPMTNDLHSNGQTILS